MMLYPLVAPALFILVTATVISFLPLVDSFTGVGFVDKNCCRRNKPRFPKLITLQEGSSSSTTSDGDPSFAQTEQAQTPAPISTSESTPFAFRDDDEAFLTPLQIKELRKETSKRSSRKQLAIHYLQTEETGGDWSEDTLTEISDLLGQQELVQVRSISLDDKKGIRELAEQLAFDLQAIVVQVKGHAAVLYTPAQNEKYKKIQLRTNYKANQWSKRPKPKRDNRGQVIPGEYEYFD